jgi:hypothetical protein
MPKKDRGHHKMKATHNAKDKQAKSLFLKVAKHVPQELSSISMKQVQQRRSSSLNRLHSTIDMSLVDYLEG